MAVLHGAVRSVAGSLYTYIQAISGRVKPDVLPVCLQYSEYTCCASDRPRIFRVRLLAPLPVGRGGASGPARRLPGASVGTSPLPRYAFGPSITDAAPRRTSDLHVAGFVAADAAGNTNKQHISASRRSALMICRRVLVQGGAERAAAVFWSCGEDARVAPRAGGRSARRGAIAGDPRWFPPPTVRLSSDSTGLCLFDCLLMITECGGVGNGGQFVMTPRDHLATGHSREISTECEL